MSEPDALTVDVNGFATRVWRKGSGPVIGFLAGYGGLPRWIRSSIISPRRAR